MIQELMIINQAGIALFYHDFLNNNRLDDEQSLASYFDIICRFTKREFKESLKMLTLDSFIFFFFNHSSGFHLVLKCDNKDIDKRQLESFSETIIDDFLLRYKGILKDFNGEISQFKSYSTYIIQFLDTKFKNFKKTRYIEL
ncbi:MAG: hypothetical protein JSV23_10065 [Promethearchaeota archaeon]|nr:MAG: hypothetical protein JSV23_10065 [Candidatus Lokiarchaeota archaeon]